MGSLSSLLTKKQDINMREEYEKQEDAGKHLLDKLPIGEVISLVCTCRNAELEKDSLFPVYCHNCKAYVQAQNGLLGEGDILLIKRLVKQLKNYAQVWGYDEAKLVCEGEMLVKRLEDDSDLGMWKI